MGTLPSGLGDSIAATEDLTRFLTSSGQFNSTMAKPAAFLPNPKDGETSLFRHGAEPKDQLWAIGQEHAVGERTLYGAAVLIASDVLAAGLILFAEEPPPRHAAIIGWPKNDDDLELQRAQQREKAAVLASKATLVLR